MVARWRNLPVTLLLSCIIVVRPVFTTPSLDFPINSQLPPVARISRPFSFVFSSQTFTSKSSTASPGTNSSLTYSLRNPPPWLKIDSAARRLYGTPEEKDIGPGEVVGVPIELVATDSHGASVTASPTLVVSRNPAPALEVPLSGQLSKLGLIYSAPLFLMLHPSTVFQFSFDQHTFGKGGLNFYAVSGGGDNSPLPSWIHFDAESLQFSGQTPAFETLVQPPQTFHVNLVASDVVGFASAEVAFSLVVGTHELTAETSPTALNATRGKGLKYEDLLKDLKLDGKALDPDLITSVTLRGLPGWLRLDQKSWKLHGTPDQNAQSSNVTIAIVDKFQDNVNVTIAIHIESDIFQGDLPALKVVSGDRVSFDVKPHLRDHSDVELSLDDDNEFPWLRLGSGSQVLTGSAPAVKSVLNGKIKLTAKSRRTRETSSRSITVRLSPGPKTTTSPTPTPTASLASATTTPSPPNKALLWLLLPGILLLIALVALFFCLCRRRRRRQREEQSQWVGSDGRPKAFHVSAPIPDSFVHHKGGSLAHGSIRDMFDVGGTHMVKKVSHQSDASPSLFRGSMSSRPESVKTTNQHGGTKSVANAKGAVLKVPYWGNAPPPRFSGPAAAVAIGQRKQTPFMSHITRPSDEDDRRTGFSADSSSVHSGTSLESGLSSNAYIEEGTAALLSVKRQSPVIHHSPVLGVPVVYEPFSIQSTPEIAYLAGGHGHQKSGSGSSSSHGAGPLFPPGTAITAVHSATAPGASSTGNLSSPGLGIKQTTQSPSLRVAAGKRLSGLLKRGSSTLKRSSHLSDSTAHTSILSTNGAAGFASIDGQTLPKTRTTLTAQDAVARPTIIHVPNRPGEMRQISRRVGDASPLFGGGSVVSSRRYHDLSPSSAAFPAAKAASEPTFDNDDARSLTPPLIIAHDDTAATCDSDTSWDRLARNSLGIAYKDLVQPMKTSSIVSASPTPMSPLSPRKVRAQNKASWDMTWNDQSSKNLMSPDQWPRPLMMSGGKGPPSDRSASPTLIRAPVGPTRLVKDDSVAPTTENPTYTDPFSHTPSPFPNNQHKKQKSRDQAALNSFKALLTSGTAPQPPPPLRPLPETPRAPLGERSNTNVLAYERRSVKSMKSVMSAKSIRSVVGDDDDDLWEDIPPARTPGEEAFGMEQENGSFNAFI